MSPDASIAIDQRFGLWTVIDAEPIARGKNNYYHCRCTCGLERSVQAATLRAGLSSGCRRCRNPSRTHGRSGTKEHQTWKGLLRRARHRPRNYEHVEVCDRWLPGSGGFEAFLADMGEAPTQEHTIDRMDNARGYSPDNCRWATPQEQALNTCRNRVIEVDGELQPVAVFAERFGVDRDLVYGRLDRGWRPKEALGLLPHKKNRQNQRGAKAYNAELSLANVREIRQLVGSGGMTRREAAAKFGVSYWSVCNVMQNKSWAWDESAKWGECIEIPKEDER